MTNFKLYRISSSKEIGCKDIADPLYVVVMYTAKMYKGNKTQFKYHTNTMTITFGFALTLWCLSIVARFVGALCKPKELTIPQALH